MGNLRDKIVNGSRLSDGTSDKTASIGELQCSSTTYMSLLARYCKMFDLVRQCKKDTVKVLDIGCTNACAYRLYTSKNFQSPSRKRIEYIGVDLDDVQIEKASVECNKINSIRFSHQLFHKDITEPFEWLGDWQPDVIWFTEVIEHVPRDKAHLTLLNAKAVSHKDTTMFLSTPSSPIEGQLVWPDSHDWEYTREELAKELDENGWDVQDMYGIKADLMYAKKVMREKYPDMLELYNKIRSRSSTVFAAIAIQALLPEVCRTLGWICKPK